MFGSETLDVLMITHQRPDYVRLSLPRLIESLDDQCRLWLWHNGDDEETLDVVREFADHPRVHRFHHSPENKGIRLPTNWMWSQSEGSFVSKVDDDCLIDENWVSVLRGHHERSPEAGVLGSWRFYEEDYRDDDARRKIQKLSGGDAVLRNHWVQGSGYFAKRELIEAIGLIGDGETFPDWCIRAARLGYVNGWVFPFLHEEHMDDPRSPWTMYTDDEIFMQYRPLSAVQTGVTTTDGWTRQMKRSAYNLQRASLDIRQYEGWRLWLRNVGMRVSDTALKLRSRTR